MSVDSENQRVASNNILTEANITLPFKLLLLYKSVSSLVSKSCPCKVLNVLKVLHIHVPYFFVFSAECLSFQNNPIKI